MAGLRDEDIQAFGSFTNTLHQPEIAKDYLKHNNYDIEKALDEWYTRDQDPNLYKNQEPAWSSGQYGPANQMQAMPPEPWDWAPDSIYPLGTDPMSRPPSRNTQGQREHVAWAGQEQTMGTTRNDDVQMQEAIERSRRDMATVASVGPSTSPSASASILTNRGSTYDQPAHAEAVPRRRFSFEDLEELEPLPPGWRQHSVVEPVEISKKVTFCIPGESLTNSAPKILDPEPKDRSRQVGAPAFIKPLPDGDFLPSLITILHSIPRCRQELLSTDDLLPEYKCSDRWWEGDFIETARVISIEEPEDTQSSAKEILYETQRLMAFLDKTSRAYGSAEALSKIVPVGATAEDHYVRFMRSWDKIALSNASNTRHDYGSWDSMFSSKMVSASPIQNLTLRDELAARIFLNAEHVPDEAGVTLYDALDRAILGDPNEERLWMHKQFAPVIAIHMNSASKARRMHVPGVFFVDRYLEQNAEYVHSSRTLIQQEISQCEEIGNKIAKIETFSHPQPFKPGNATKLMSTTMAYLKERSANSNAASVNGDANEAEVQNDEFGIKAKRVLEQLESISNSLKERLNGLYEQKKECEEKIRAYSKCGTHPDDPQFPASVKYQLRGFATSGYQRPSVTYAIYPTRKFGQNGLLGGKEEPQWWKLSYDTRYAAVVQTNRVSEEQVLDAASEINYNILLVYVHDDFLEADGNGTQLPPQLKDFVERDNDIFSRELNETWDGPVVLEGVPVEGNPAWDSPDSDVTFGEPGPAIGREQDFVTDPTVMEGNEGVPAKVQEMEEIRREEPLSPKKRKKLEDVDSDMETMAPDSDIEMQS